MGGRGRLTGVLAAAFAALPLAAVPAAASDVFNEAGSCTHTDRPSRLVTPTAGQSFEVRMRPGVANSVGAQIQADLVAHNVQANLNAGLGSNPLGFPNRPIPIFLVPGDFDSDGNAGDTSYTCSDKSVEAIVVRTDDPPKARAATAAHELFHAYSAGVPPTTGRPGTAWWEEASAGWSEQKNGLPEPKEFDSPWMQRPGVPLDSRTSDHEYGMWRFVQFLDDRGYVGPTGGPWPLEREVIAGYANVNDTLASSLGSRGTSLADELAAFWGDRIKAKPMHGPPLHPTPAQTVTLRTGTTTVSAKAKPLATWFRNYKVADGVKRVTFHFEPEGDGQFWGAPSAFESRRFQTDDVISFCVGADNGADLVWPKRGFPVTFTNGHTSGAQITGKIEITAQRDSEQCGGTPSNPACKLLAEAPVSALFGSGTYPFYSGSDGTWRCIFVNRAETQEVDAVLRKAPPGQSLKQLRKQMKQSLAQGGFKPIRAGDVAGIITSTTEDSVIHTVLMLVGRRIILLDVWNASEAEAIEAARLVAGVA